MRLNKFGRCGLVIFEKGVKVNSAKYIEVLEAQEIKSSCK